MQQNELALQETRLALIRLMREFKHIPRNQHMQARWDQAEYIIRKYNDMLKVLRSGAEIKYDLKKNPHGKQDPV